MSLSIDDTTRLCIDIDKLRLKNLAEYWKSKPPVTIVSEVCERSCGSAHEYYSEGDYWWPDPENPEGPYVRRDGESNPNNFDAHRQLLRSFSMAVPALTSAGLHLNDNSLLELAVDHLKAWFVDDATRMEPHLEYGQAIKGICKGRGIGIVDMVHLAEVSVATEHLIKSGTLKGNEKDKVLNWFESYLKWLSTSGHGIDERDHGNNHSTCWAMQVAAIANLVHDHGAMKEAYLLYQGELLKQIDSDGSMPLELERTRPYNYSFFNLELFAALVQSLSRWYPAIYDIETPIYHAFNYLLPYASDPDLWPHQQDITYREHYPIRWSSILFFGIHYNNEKAVEIWKSLPADSTSPEVQRNTPIRQPILWFS